MGLNRSGKRNCVLQTKRNGFVIARFLCDGGKITENKCGEKSCPHALPFSLATDGVHSVIPIARSEQDKPVFADFQCGVQTGKAMFVNGRTDIRPCVSRKAFVFAVRKRLTVNERYIFGKKCGVFRQPHIQANGVRKP